MDIVILSNGPGEMATWVLPTVRALRQKLGKDRSQVRISVILSPCPHASGREATIARSYPEVDRVQPPEAFFPFLLWGKTAENWDWRKRGVVLFLGGDQFYALLVGRRLGYRTVVYAEWEARWYRWIDRFGVRQPSVREGVPLPYQGKCTVVGDLMADVSQSPSPMPDSPRRLALLPGSKPGKLAQGVPLCLAIAQQVRQYQPEVEFILPLAPTLDLQQLAEFADSQHNPLVSCMGGTSAQLRLPEANSPALPYLETPAGLRVTLVTEFPAHAALSPCQLALTTVGANTAELAALGLPMLVLLPTQQFDAMRNWDGIPGLLAGLPLVGSTFAKLINWFVLRQGRLFAWPNIWAGEEIVPELTGNLEAAAVAELVLDYLDHPEKLAQMRDRLRQVRGESGAATRLAEIVCEQLENIP
jgi:lipid-A-disaccharide synthase